MPSSNHHDYSIFDPSFLLSSFELPLDSTGNAGSSILPSYTPNLNAFSIDTNLPLINSVDNIEPSLNLNAAILRSPDPPITSAVTDFTSRVTFSSTTFDAYGKQLSLWPSSHCSHQEDNLSFFDDLSPSISMPTQNHTLQSLPAEQSSGSTILISTPLSGSTTSPASSQSIQSFRRRQQSLTPGSRENPVSVDRIEKRQRNNVAARKYRQKRIDRIEELEAALSRVTKERDDLRIKAARSDAEIQLLKDMLHNSR
ncbi:gaf domain nucleotide-binding [Venturia nashicola]|nr:gaf domain nucleotide-binding [Venturia nashicola]